MTHESQIQTHYLLVNPLQLTIHLFKRLCFDLVGDGILVPVAHGVLPELGLATGVGTDEVLLRPGVVGVVCHRGLARLDRPCCLVCLVGGFCGYVR